MNIEDEKFIVDAYFEEAINFLDKEAYDFRKKELVENGYTNYFTDNIREILDVFWDNHLMMNNPKHNPSSKKYENIVFPIKDRYFVFRNYGDKYEDYWSEIGFEVKRKKE